MKNVLLFGCGMLSICGCATSEVDKILEGSYQLYSYEATFSAKGYETTVDGRADVYVKDGDTYHVISVLDEEGNPSTNTAVKKCEGEACCNIWIAKHLSKSIPLERQYLCSENALIP